jgi:hypothetical protein
MRTVCPYCPRARVPASLAGALLSYTCVLSGAAACSCARGTLVGALFATIVALALLAHAEALRRRPLPPWRAAAFAAAAAGALLGVFPACVAAAELLHARAYVPITAALAAANPNGTSLAFALAAAANSSSSPFDKLPASPAHVHLLRDVRARFDLMGEGFAFWPMCVVCVVLRRFALALLRVRLCVCGGWAVRCALRARHACMFFTRLIRAHGHLWHRLS